MLVLEFVYICAAKFDVTIIIMTIKHLINISSTKVLHIGR